MAVLISYDISNEHIIVKELLEKKDWLDYFYDEKNQKSWLPETTLWKKNIDNPNEAMNEFMSVIKSTNRAIQIERFVVTEFVNPLGVPGKPHS